MSLNVLSIDPGLSLKNQNTDITLLLYHNYFLTCGYLLYGAVLYWIVTYLFLFLEG